MWESQEELVEVLLQLLWRSVDRLWAGEAAIILLISTRYVINSWVQKLHVVIVVKKSHELVAVIYVHIKIEGTGWSLRFYLIW